MDFDLEKDYYKILGVTEDTSADDIKKAYLKLAKKHHPDVNGNSDESKEKFQEIQEAYDVLSHHSKKVRYDGMRRGSRFDNYDDFDFRHPFGFRDPRANMNARSKNYNPYDYMPKRPKPDGINFDGADTSETITISFASSIIGIKKLAHSFRIDSACPNFIKEVKESIKPCEHCHKTGILVRMVHHMHTELYTCPHCNGTGWTMNTDISKHQCDHKGCNKGVISEIKSFDLNIPHGFADGSILRMTGCGGQGVGNGVDGNHYITVNVKKDPLFEIKDRYNIHTTRVISPLSIIFGGKTFVIAPDGERIDIDIPKGFDCKPITYENKGMYYKPNMEERGKLIVEFILDDTVIDTDKWLNISSEEELKQFIDNAKHYKKTQLCDEQYNNYLSSVNSIKARNGDL
jgi:molecular chaperone DnaJ